MLIFVSTQAGCCQISTVSTVSTVSSRHMALPGDLFSPRALRLGLVGLHSGFSNNHLLLSGHNFLLESVVNNVINNITLVELPSFTSRPDTITTTRTAPRTTTEEDEETISNEIQVNIIKLCFNRVISCKHYRM